MRSQVQTHLGHGDGVRVFAPSGFPKAGGESVGGARQWCGRLGKVANCPGAMYLGYVSRKGHTLVDTRLYLPKEWTKDKARLDKAGVPKGSRGYRTRHQLALEMWANNGACLPHSWMAGDAEMGRPYWFRRRLAALGERYLLAVPSHPTIRDLEVEPPAWSGRGRPKRPWPSVEAWSQALGDEAWLRIDVRDGAKGPLVVETVQRRVVSRTHRRQQGDEEILVVIRYRDRDNQQVVKVDYYLSNAVPETPLWECARVAPKPNIASKNASREARAKPVWRIMRCVIGRVGSISKRCRYWPHGSWGGKPIGGKTWPPAMTFPQIRQGIARSLREAFQCGTMSPMLKECQKRLQRNELARFYHWKQRNRLAPLNLYKRQF